MITTSVMGLKAPFSEPESPPRSSADWRAEMTAGTVKRTRLNLGVGL